MTARPVVMDSHIKKLFQDFKKGKISANLYEAEVHEYQKVIRKIKNLEYLNNLPLNIK